jgi:hypothetical protein
MDKKTANQPGCSGHHDSHHPILRLFQSGDRPVAAESKLQHLVRDGAANPEVAAPSWCALANAGHGRTMRAAHDPLIIATQ